MAKGTGALRSIGSPGEAQLENKRGTHATENPSSKEARETDEKPLLACDEDSDGRLTIA
jgi:hypothetical protein